MLEHLLCDPAESTRVDLEAANVTSESSRDLLAFVEGDRDCGAVSGVVLSSAECHIAWSAGIEVLRGEGSSDAEEGDNSGGDERLHCDCVVDSNDRGII